VRTAESADDGDHASPLGGRPLNSILADDAALYLWFQCAIAVALTLLVIALIGVPRRSAPRCRRCRTDARPALVASAVRHGAGNTARCACGAVLTRFRGVRWRGSRRLRSLAVVGLLLLVAAAAAMWWSHRLESEGLLWRDMVPAAMLVKQVEADPTGATLADDVIPSLARRLGRGRLSVQHLRRVLLAMEPSSPAFANSDGVDDLLGLVVQFGPAALEALALGGSRQARDVPETGPSDSIFERWTPERLTERGIDALSPSSVVVPMIVDHDRRRALRQIAMAVDENSGDSMRFERMTSLATAPPWDGSRGLATSVPNSRDGERLSDNALPSDPSTQPAATRTVLSVDPVLADSIASTTWRADELDALLHDVTASDRVIGSPQQPGIDRRIRLYSRSKLLDPSLTSVSIAHAPTGWRALAACAAALLFVALLRFAAACRTPGPPRCIRCRHAVVSIDAARCVECGVEFVTRTASTSSLIRWDRHLSHSRRLVTAAAIAVLLVVVIAGGWVLGPRLTATIVDVESRELDRLVHAALRGPGVGEAWFQLVRREDGHDALVRAVRRALLEGGVPLDASSDSVEVGGLVEMLIPYSAPGGAAWITPELREILDQVLSPAALHVHGRVRSGGTVNVMTRPSLPLEPGHQLQHAIQHATLDGVPISLTGTSGDPTEFGTRTRSWFALRAPVEVGVRTLRIEWTLRVTQTQDVGVPLVPIATIWQRHFVHEQRIEIVEVDAPLALPTRESQYWPWGERTERWRLEVRPMGTRQFVRIIAVVPAAREGVLLGRWSVEQSGRSTPIGDVISSSRRLFPNSVHVGSHVYPEGRDGWSGDYLEWEVGAIVVEPLDLTKPFTIRFEPDVAAMPQDGPRAEQHEFIWDEPLEIVVAARGGPRRTIAPGWIVWDRFGAFVPRAAP